MKSNFEYTDLKDVLGLDSIYSILTWYERIELHQIMNSRLPVENISENAYNMLKIIVENDWQKPETKYPESEKDVLHFLSADGTWKTIDIYKGENEKLTNLIEKICVKKQEKLTK